MLALVIVASALLGSVNGRAIQEPAGPDHPFNLRLKSDAVEWDGQYLIPQFIGQGFDVASISPLPYEAPSFYCDHATQELRCRFTDATHVSQPSELVGAFSSASAPGQTFQPLYFAAKDTKDMDTTKGLGFTTDDFLTFNNAPCHWYACNDTVARIPGANKMGMPIFALNLLVGEAPRDPSCKRVQIVKERK